MNDEPRATRLRHLSLDAMRVFDHAELDVPAEGTTLVTGPNGSGKTTVLEAVAYLGTQRSFRSTARDAMVQIGQERAFVHGRFEREGRPLSVDAEIFTTGRTRTLVNNSPVRARAALAEAVPTTIFSPDDLGLVQGPPARRRALLDTTLRLVDREAAAALDDLERVLRQRAALLRQVAGRLGPEAAITLDVWDDRLARTGSAVGRARRALLEDLEPYAEEAYAGLAGAPRAGRADGAILGLVYRPGWSGDLGAELAAARKEDVRRGITTVGPHRDDVWATIGGRDARVHASQGEQRSLALALRLGVHRLVTHRAGGPPILLLDDVFSELDADRSRALVAELPEGQALLTTAAAVPDGVSVAAVVDVRTLRRSGREPV